MQLQTDNAASSPQFTAPSVLAFTDRPTRQAQGMDASAFWKVLYANSSEPPNAALSFKYNSDAAILPVEMLNVTGTAPDYTIAARAWSLMRYIYRDNRSRLGVEKAYKMAVIAMLRYAQELAAGGVIEDDLLLECSSSSSSPRRTTLGLIARRRATRDTPPRTESHAFH